MAWIRTISMEEADDGLRGLMTRHPFGFKTDLLSKALESISKP
jgi:hypothetical protein